MESSRPARSVFIHLFKKKSREIAQKKNHDSFSHVKLGHQGQGGQYSPDEIEKMAEYSANLYAKNESEKAHYLEYYRNYYKNGGDPNGGQQQNPQKIDKYNGNNSKKDQDIDHHGKVIVNGVEYQIYRKYNCNMN